MTGTCRPEALPALLTEDALTEASSADSVLDHLETCAECRSRLEALAADRSWWQGTRELLTDVPAIDVPGFGEAATLALADSLLDSVAPDVVDPARYLETPVHPEMLGRLGPYDIERVIGQGGMGVVLKGFDTDLNRPVAIKMLAPHLASSGTARQRFVREARAAAAVVHEHVVPIHGIDTQGPLPWIVMPYIAGPSLETHIARHGALDPLDIVRIARQVAAGLTAAHELGLVHRDIKPGNIMLENGLSRVQITDFGLARAADDSNLTRSGVIAGTPYFMSPEQAAGERVDQRSDLFSLGSVLYVMATGRRPFNAETPLGVLHELSHSTPVRVREIAPEVPERLESLINTLMEKRPEDRFANATQLCEYLGDYLAHLQQPTVSPPPRRLRTAASRRRTRRLMAAAIIVIVANAGAAWRAFGPRPEPRPDHLADGASVLFQLLPQEQFDREVREAAALASRLEQTPTRLENTAASSFTADLQAVASRLNRLVPTEPTITPSGVLDAELAAIRAAVSRLEAEDSQTPERP